MTIDGSWSPVAARWLMKGTGILAPGRLSVLIFHRVLPVCDPLFPDEVHAARFDGLMRLVARGFNVLTLGEALAAREAGRLPPRALTITFDDGYADNAEIALPILHRHGLKATFFVATGFLDGGRMFNDSVIETLRRTNAERIDLSDFGLGSLTMSTVQERRTAIDTLLQKVKYLDLQAREAAITLLHRLAGHPDLPGNLMMRSDQVRQLAKAGMELGGHTVQHPILRVLPDAQAEAEIVRGRSHLQALIDSPVEVFAYPNGQPGQDYDERHVAMLRRLGFRGAVSTALGTVTDGSDRFQLPRFTPWDKTPGRWVGRLALERIRANGR